MEPGADASGALALAHEADAAARHDRRRRRWVAVAVGLTSAAALLAGCAQSAPVRELADPPQVALAQQLPELAPTPTPVVAPPAEAPQAEGATFATVTVPRFGDAWSVPVHEGITDPILNRDGVGHFPDSALAGQVGNFALAGHRTLGSAPLYDIDLLVDGDEIVVTTATGRYTYAVSGSEIVTPDAMRVVGPDPQNPGEPATDAILTLVACHPKGSVEFRWITYATLVSAEAVGAG